MFRLTRIILLIPLLATPCLAKQFPLSPSGELPVAAIEFTEPENVRHFGMTKDEEVVLYFVGIGPSTTDNLEK
jgi:hypothetical protein